eukprot:TRINITY_DN1727_c0_g1_i1.p1 TRINITY_DN1727_c0_g1~~TRINITY_DN1727_c0_g1_i1.p1  ORF type:complete len:501 (-),score=110.25 TRINITY_DN1727_c0_g1_i1:201-1631(-)
MSPSSSFALFFLFFSLAPIFSALACGNDTDIFTQVRFVHSASKLGTVASVTCKGVPLGKGLSFGQATETFAFAPEESYEVQVSLESLEVAPLSVYFHPNTTYIFYLSYNSTTKQYSLAFTTNPLKFETNALLSVVNALTASTTVTFEVVQNSSIVFSAHIPYASSSATAIPTLVPGNFTIKIVVGAVELLSSSVTLNDKTSYTVISAGDSESKDSARLLLLKESDAATTNVRFAHAVPDAGPVSLEVDCKEVVSNVTFGQYVPASPIALRSYVTAVTVTANGEPVISETLRLNRGSNYFIFVSGTVENKSLSLTVHEENYNFDHSKSYVSIGNLVPDSKSLMVTYLVNKTQDLQFQEFVGQQVDPSSYNFKFFKASSLRRRLRMFRRIANGQLTEEPLIQKDQTLQQGSSYLVVVQGTLSNLTVSVVETSSTPSDDGGLSKGAIAGIIIACIVGAILVIGVVIYIYRRRSNYESIR